MKRKNFLVGLFLASGFISYSVLAQDDLKISGMVYSYGLSYNNSILKDNGYVFGIYGSMGLGYASSLEAAYEYTHIKYKANNPDLNQNDVTVVFTNYSIPETKLRAGFHYITSDDDYTDEGYTIIASVGKYKMYVWDANLDMYYTHYKNYVLPDNSKGLDVYQLSPNVGFGWGNPNTSGRFYFKTIATYIRHSDDVGFGKDFVSLEERVTYILGPLAVTGSIWLGERSFMVDNGGFTVFNLKEKYKNGYGIKATYILSKNLSISGAIRKQQFEEVDNPKDVDIYTYGVNLGFLF